MPQTPMLPQAPGIRAAAGPEPARAVSTGNLGAAGAPQRLEEGRVGGSGAHL